MPPFLPFEQKLLAAWPLERWREVRVLAAVSGGPDSVALLRALDRLSGGGPGLAAAHFNHGLRGEAAVADEQFVSGLCGNLGLECAIGQAQGMSVDTGGEGLEATARAARYEFLTRSAEQMGARYVATAHTADDQAETILHHIVRGTGLRGLSGMPRVRSLSPAVTMIRPMLGIARSEVLAYLAALGQPYREDETNRELSLTRNRIRHELLPMLAREYSPSIVESLLRLGTLAGDAQDLIGWLSVWAFEKSMLECGGARVVFQCERLRDDPRHLVREVLIEAWRRQGWPRQSMGYEQWDQLADMVIAEEAEKVSTQLFPGGVIAERKGARLVLSVAAAREAT